MIVPSYEELLARCMARVPGDIDKREGSIIYDAISPAIFEVAQVYMELDNLLNLAMLDTACGEFLDRVANQYDIYRLPAIRAARKMTVIVDEGVVVPNGTRFNLSNSAVFVVSSQLDAFTYEVTAEVAGKCGNINGGSATLLGYLDGFKSAEIKDIIIYGEEVETDDALRIRIKQALSRTPVDGNIAQYVKWASEFDGIGRAKVFPLWLGGNTVKVSITNANNQVASEELVAKFQSYLDPQSKGLGNGKAPIGAKVTVSSGIKKGVDIRCEVKLAQGYTTPEGIAECITNFLSTITYAKSVISYMQLGSEILNVPSVADIRNLFVCGAQVDVILVDEDIPMLNTLDVVVV